jgi:hypothetical protein
MASSAPSRRGGAGRIHRGVAAAVDDDGPAELEPLPAGRVAEYGQGVEDAGGLTGRDVGAVAELGADGQKHRVEVPIAHRSVEIVDPGVELQCDAER